MTTVDRRALVSLAAVMTITLALGACVHAPSRSVLDEPSRMHVRPFAIRFDNEERDYVHVYLIGDKREWLLGRVQPGATAMLRIPEESLENSTFLRLAVVPADRVTFQSVRHSGAKLTIAQPASALASQRWRFTQGQLTSLQR